MEERGKDGHVLDCVCGDNPEFNAPARDVLLLPLPSKKGRGPGRGVPPSQTHTTTFKTRLLSPTLSSI